MRQNWCRTFQLMTAHSVQRLAQVRYKYGEQMAEEIIEWARKKGVETPYSFWDWLDEAQRTVDSGGSLA